jgi:hypothetical protein
MSMSIHAASQAFSSMNGKLLVFMKRYAVVCNDNEVRVSVQQTAGSFVGWLLLAIHDACESDRCAHLGPRIVGVPRVVRIATVEDVIGDVGFIPEQTCKRVGGHVAESI